MRGEGMFAQARATDGDMGTLGEQMGARKKEALAQIKAEGLPAPATRTMKDAKVTLGEPVT